jgi:hypothetical protein
MNKLREAAQAVVQCFDTHGFVLEYRIKALRDALAEPDEVLAEREACAKVADDYAENQQAWSYGLDSPEEYRMQAGHECADAIRARGNT